MPLEKICFQQLCSDPLPGKVRCLQQMLACIAPAKYKFLEQLLTMLLKITGPCCSISAHA